MVKNAILNGNRNQVSIVNAENILITELPLAFPGGSIPIDGRSTPVAKIVTVFENLLAAQRKAASLKSQSHLAVLDADAQLVAARAMVRDIGNFAEVSLGPPTRSSPRSDSPRPRRA